MRERTPVCSHFLRLRSIVTVAIILPWTGQAVLRPSQVERRSMGIRKESPEWVGRNTPATRRTYPINQEAESFLRLLSLFDLTTLRLHEPARATSDMPARTPPAGAPGSQSPISPQQAGADAAREDERAAEERDNILPARAARERVHRKPAFYGSADRGGSGSRSMTPNKYKKGDRPK
jgi:hypothetical protein